MNAKEIDPQIQAIFDAIEAFMAGKYTSSNANVNYDGAGTNRGITASDGNRNSWTYSEYISGWRVTVSPLGVSLGAGQQQQFTASASNPNGQPVPGAKFVWSVLPGGLGSIDADGLYTAPAVVAAASSDTVRCELTGQGQPSWASIGVSLHI